MVLNTFQTITITGSGAATPIVFPGEGTVLVLNQSGTNTVYVGFDPGIGPNNLNFTAPLLPNGSAVFSGKRAVFATCSAGETAVVAIFPKSSSFYGGTQA